MSAPKTVLITGATDGLGLETARRIAAKGNNLVIHGRSGAKLTSVQSELRAIPGAGTVKTLEADLSDLKAVHIAAEKVASSGDPLDVVINNAGVFKTSSPRTSDGLLDVRFAVNTFAPYVLTRRLAPLMSDSGRIVNLSSAAQAPVDMEALLGRGDLGDFQAYAQSKLALTMFSVHLAASLPEPRPTVLAVNPGSFLGTKMVAEAYGRAGNDIGIGADILVACALSDKFSGITGKYFDNDAGGFGPPHPDALDPAKCAELVGALDCHLGAA